MDWRGFCYAIIDLCFVSIIGNAYKQKSIVTTIISLCAIPLSFYPFLILPESCFLTYYAICLIMLMEWYVLDGIDFVKEWLFKKQSRSKVVYILVLAVVLQSSGYAQNVWINYNRDSYEYLANTISSKLSQSEEIDTIAVYGSLSPYVGGREYVIFAVENVLSELGYSSQDFIITQSDNEYYITIFNDGEVAGMETILGAEKLEKVFQYYIHDDLYSRWIYNGNATEDDELDFLQECFVDTGQIVLEGNNVISISMEGFNARNPF